MKKKVNYGKILLVVFITALIWIWADLAIESTLDVQNATITVAKSTSPDLMVRFGKNSDSVSVAVENLRFRGASSKVAIMEKRMNDGTWKAEFFLDIAKEKMDKAGQYSFDVLNFLREDKTIRQMGLTVESCEPKIIPATVYKLVEKPLTVKCIDENGSTIKTQMIDPPTVSMFVPEDWSGDKLAAYVRLQRSEEEQAKVTILLKKPYIVLPGNEKRESRNSVRVNIPQQESRLEDYTVQAKLAIAMSPTLEGKYTVEIINLAEVLSPISIRATAEAKQAYELQAFPPMTLYILDDDKKNQEEKKRQVEYNFPVKYVRTNDIELKQQPVMARFKLIPIPGNEQEASPKPNTP